MKSRILVILLLAISFRLCAQDSEILGDNVLRFYRLAIPVTKSAYEEDLDSDYNNVLAFWRECEDYVNNLYVPLGFCFDVIEDEKLVLHEHGMIDENVYNAPSFGTELLNELIPSTAYDIGMWVTHRDDYEENSGLSVENGVYLNSTKASGYAKTDKWVVAHEIGHLLGANHTPPGEGSLMDQIGNYLSYPTIKRIRSACMERNAAYYSDEQRTQLVGSNAGGNYVYGVNVENTAPAFVTARMAGTYRIPQGGCLAVELFATDADGDALRYMAIGDDIESFASLQPQESNVVDYRPRYSADVYYPEYFYKVQGTDIPMLYPGNYGIKFIVYDSPADCSLEAMKAQPFYSNYAVWDANVEVVAGTEFTASFSPAKDVYNAGEAVMVQWGVNTNYFTDNSRLRITMSTNYGETFDYVLAESVPAKDGCCTVVFPDVNVSYVDVDFVTATRSMRAGIIKVEEIGGVAYTLTTLAPENGGGFTVTGGVESAIQEIHIGTESVVYDLFGRKLSAADGRAGIVVKDGKKYYRK